MTASVGSPSSVIQIPGKELNSWNILKYTKRVFGGFWSRLDHAFLIILALPWLIQRLDNSWLFDAVAFLDPWFYLGYFMDPTHHLQAFAGTYYGSRLAWILPGAFAYHVFPPGIATYALHITFEYTALFSLYLTLKNTVGRRAGVLATILMGSHSYFLWAIGWDYVDGAAITYLLLALCCLTYAANSARPGWWLLLGGAAVGLMLHTQLFLVCLTPLLGYYYYAFAKREYSKNPLASSIGPLAWGFLGITCILCIASYLLGGRFLFFMANLNETKLVLSQGNRWRDASYGWLPHAMWLVIPAVVALSSTVWLLYRRGNQPLSFCGFWQRFFLLNLLVMLLWQLLGQPVLQFPYYASYLMPSAFLALGAQMGVATSGLGKWQFRIFCGCAVLVLCVPFAPPVTSTWMGWMQAHSPLFPFVLGAAGAGLICLNTKYSRLPGLVLLLAALAGLSTASSTRAWGTRSKALEATKRREQFLTVVDGFRVAQDLDPSVHVLFWFDVKERQGLIYNSVAAMDLWGYRLVSDSFPWWGENTPSLHAHIAILTEDRKERALQKTAQALRTIGLSAQYLDQRRIERGSYDWNMILIEVVQAPSSPTGAPTPKGSYEGSVRK
jgi:hypothetical protein